MSAADKAESLCSGNAHFDSLLVLALYDRQAMSKSRALTTGFFAGVVAGIAMTVAMLLLAWAFNIATPLVILGDRLSVFISPKPFFWIMGRVGGYNHLKQLGVGSSMLGQILVGAIGGMVYGIVRRKDQQVRY